jgi:hypothetical protein
MLYQIQELIDSLSLEELTQEQRQILRDNYNTYINFECGFDTEDSIVFKMKKRSFGHFEYYLGMEYEKEDIIYKIETGDEIVVAYNNGNDRVTGIIERLGLLQLEDLIED